VTAVSSDQDRFDAFLDALRARVQDQAIDDGEDGSDGVAIGFREDAFTEVILRQLEDLGQVPGGDVCFFERRLGQGIGKVNAWYVDEEAGQVDLFATVYRGLGPPTSVTTTELTQVVQRAARLYDESSRAIHREMEPASPAYDMMERLHEVRPDITQVRVIVLVDGTAAELGSIDFRGKRLHVQVEVWDLRRLFRLASSGVPYEATRIDIAELMGEPLACLEMPESQADYRSYLAIIPGTLLHALYQTYGSRLLELNVRSFLQARKKVNSGIRKTLQNEPARFLAYNNGISATAEGVEVTRRGDGALGITHITGLQIVNGGQTVASIHRARERDRADLSDVYVQAKLSIVRPEQIDTLVPLISRYANTQNKVDEADFSANHPFHVRLQQLAETTWTPGETSRWFYERARGQYEVARARDGTTTARLRRFDQATPTSQRFDKVDLAKYLNAWDQLPHIVSRGGQKNFIALMERLAKTHRADWEPDAGYFRSVVAQAIIFRSAARIAKQMKLPGYAANAVAYTVSLLSYRTAGRLDLAGIWAAQQLSPALEATLHEWMPEVHAEIIDSAGARNVTEWAKREEAWRHIQTLPLRLSADLEDELAEGQPLPTVGDSAGKKGLDLTHEDRENIARVMQISADQWVRISGWGARTGEIPEWQVGLAISLAGYAAGGWAKVPSKKQATHAMTILKSAEDGDVLAEEDADEPVGV
jgi:hypothetical protein